MNTEYPVISPKKLIEVALPLDAINAAAAREKSIRHGHPSTLHLWWARRPLAAARAVIFSQLVNDPDDLWRCQNPNIEPNQQVKGHWTKARARLFGIIEELVRWENTTDEVVLEKAREEIRKSWRETCELNKHHPHAKELFNPGKVPALHDPFAGGGAIPLEAQRLGLEAFASDLNPVAVLINKAMIEIPPKFASRGPVNPDARRDKGARLQTWHGAQGLAEDVRYYGRWMRDEAFKRIGHLYPPVAITARMVEERPDLKPYEGQKLTVIAWIWARTVNSPNPAFSHVQVPLSSSFVLCSKKGHEAWVEPVIGQASSSSAGTTSRAYQFRIAVGTAPVGASSGTKLARGANFRCLLSGIPISPEHIKSEAMNDRMGAVMLGIVAEGNNGRVYLSPSDDHENLAKTAIASDARLAIHVPLAIDTRNLWCLRYGIDHFDKLYTSRQILAVSTLIGLIDEVRQSVGGDVRRLAGDDSRSFPGYADAIALYLALSVSRLTMRCSAQAGWDSSYQKIQNAFGRQAIPMVWDFCESNPFCSATGSFDSTYEAVADVFRTIPSHLQAGVAEQANAALARDRRNLVISTDPPYYDNISYANLSDYFYVWLRIALRSQEPVLLSTISVPKNEEMVAAAERHGSKAQAERFFLAEMTKALAALLAESHPAIPITIYYAFKQSETDRGDGDVSNTGWVTFLDAVIKVGLTITGTWPVRTEMKGRALERSGYNALASSVVLVCRPRDQSAPTVSRREFIRELNGTLPVALDMMTRESEGLHSPVAPVDLSQAIIGPGMGVFSKYSAVLEADGSPMSVKMAIQLINRFLAEDDFDADTQFCLRWFEQHGWSAGHFGEADVLARAKGTSVHGVQQSGVLYSASGSVRLFKWPEYPTGWNPAADSRLPIWEVLHQLIRVFKTDGESGAGAVLAAVQHKAEAARQLAYRLYTLCERAGQAEDARAYNELITSWSAIESAAAKQPAGAQRTLFE